ncbi:MAG: U-box domain-containing protein, partial [Pseudobdellovibrio sp.]
MEPVITCDGFTFEKKAILQHFETNGATNPLTKQPLSTTQVFVNTLVQNLISTYKQEALQKTLDQMQKILFSQEQNLTHSACLSLLQPILQELDQYCEPQTYDRVAHALYAMLIHSQKHIQLACCMHVLLLVASYPWSHHMYTLFWPKSLYTQLVQTLMQQCHEWKWNDALAQLYALSKQQESNNEQPQDASLQVYSSLLQQLKNLTDTIQSMQQKLDEQQQVISSLVEKTLNQPMSNTVQ